MDHRIEKALKDSTYREEQETSGTSTVHLRDTRLLQEVLPHDQDFED